MKALYYNRYGGTEVLQLKELPKPVPGDTEVLIRIHATTATAAEKLMRTGKPYWGRLILGLRKPRKKYRIPGIELAGEIESTGNRVTRFKKGDAVYGFAGFRPGACAEYLCLDEKASLEHKPVNLNYAEAATLVDGATTSYFFLHDKAKIDTRVAAAKASGSMLKVLIIGASGSIGTAAVQLAKYFGAEVTGICSTSNVERVKSLGADKLIDYTREDFTKKNETWDLIFDTVGKSNFMHCRKALTQNGVYLPTIGLINHFHSLWTSLVGGRRVIAGMSVHKHEALKFIKKLAETGRIVPVIDRYYPLEQAAEAHRYVESGHKKGNVVIRILPEKNS